MFNLSPSLLSFSGRNQIQDNIQVNQLLYHETTVLGVQAVLYSQLQQPPLRFLGLVAVFSECFFKSIFFFQHQFYERQKQITDPIFSWIRRRANLTGMELLMFLTIFYIFSYSSPSTFPPILMVFLQMKTLILNVEVQVKYTSAVSSKPVMRDRLALRALGTIFQISMHQVRLN